MTPSPTAASTLVTSAASVMLGGTASDNLDVARVAWTNSAGGSGTATGTTSWSTAAIQHHDRQPCRDARLDGAHGLDRHERRDELFDHGTVQLTGSASDPSGIELVTWRIPSTGSNGGAIGTTSWTTTIINLNPGPNYIEVTAYDRAGNPITTSIEITRT